MSFLRCVRWRRKGAGQHVRVHEVEAPETRAVGREPARLGATGASAAVESGQGAGHGGARYPLLTRRDTLPQTGQTQSHTTTLRRVWFQVKRRKNGRVGAGADRMATVSKKKNSIAKTVRARTRAGMKCEAMDTPRKASTAVASNM